MTNITEQHMIRFKFLREAPDEQIGLVSCFRDGTPTAAICRVTESKSGTCKVVPLFVAVDDDMTLTDHDNKVPN